jgi:hypothetical protein
MAIPVYISRYQTLPDPYGAFIRWDIGEKCLWKTSWESLTKFIYAPR